MEDVRPFAKLLRGIGLKHVRLLNVHLMPGSDRSQNAILDATEDLVTVTVEDARTLCGTPLSSCTICDMKTLTAIGCTKSPAVAYIPSHIFSSWTFRRTDFPATFEFSLDSLLQCLNIFGNAGSSGRENISNLRSKRRWAGEAENVAGEGGGADEERRWAKERKGMTGMRMEWMGPGYELNLLLYVRYLPSFLFNPLYIPADRVVFVLGYACILVLVIQARRIQRSHDDMRFTYPRSGRNSQPNIRSK